MKNPDIVERLRKKLADGDGLDWGERAVLIDKLREIERLRQRVEDLEAKLALANEYTQFCHENHWGPVDE